MAHSHHQPLTSKAPRIFRRGRTIEIIGLSGVLLTLAAVLSLLAWTWRTADHLAAENRRQSIHSLALAIAPACEGLIDAGQISSLRIMLVELARLHELSEAALLLPDGAVLAHSDPRRISVKELPQTWGTGPAAPPPLLEPGAIQVAHAHAMPSRGTLTLILSAPPPVSTVLSTNAVGGLLGIAAAAIGLSLLLLQRTCIILRPLRAIQDALRSLAQGERSPAALTISPRWGPEAAAWNAAMAERQALETRLLDRRLEEAAAAPWGAGGAPGGAGDGALDRACDVMPQAILVLDPAGAIRYANGAAGVLLGCRRSELTGRPFETVVREENVIALVRQVLTGSPTHSGGPPGRRRGSVEVEHGGGGGGGDERSVVRYTCCRITADSDDTHASMHTSGSAFQHLPAGVVIHIEDLTQQRTADRARETFVAHATHELRTPLTNIRLYIETFLESSESDLTLRGQCINVINQEARRLERMVSDMLSVAEIEAGSMKINEGDIRLESLFEELRTDYIAPAAEKEIILQFDLPPKLPVIRGDRDKIAMTLHNLIGNALKYTPAGGAISVCFEESPTAVSFHIKDNGIGVAPDEQERIFDKFYRSRDKRIARITGTGLGLALAREVARLHGGDITVKSEPDRGSLFTLTLPIHASAGHSVHPASHPVAASPTPAPFPAAKAA